PGQSPPGRRFPAQAKLAVAGRSQSVDLDDHHKPEFRRVFSSSIIENGHQLSSGLAHVSHEAASFHGSDSSPEAHAPAVALQMPHLPVTAVTRAPEKFSGETVSPTGANSSTVDCCRLAVPQSSFTAVTFSLSAETTTSAATSASAVSYGTSSGSTAAERYREVTSTNAAQRHAERRRELVRSQTLPRTSGAQARKALLEKLEQDSGRGKGETRAKLKRSQSFGVASASSIKQILLDWCRSKTVGYQHVDLQNFSSSWNDGMAFCALVHSFFPEAFDYSKLDPTHRKQNFELAFTTAEKLAHCDRLIEVDDMMLMGYKPDPMCVFTYVQSLYNHLRHFE
ncbi:SMTL2 protein, partial [Rhinopomastus cyanomelas]|nr:SMTL2 protein [Rhinopomastus cyanomelas]